MREAMREEYPDDWVGSRSGEPEDAAKGGRDVGSRSAISAREPRRRAGPRGIGEEHYFDAGALVRCRLRRG